jgi:hypothetical protein
MKNFVQSMFQSSPVMLIMKDDISTRDVFVFVENNPASLSECEERRMRGWHFAKGKSLRDFHGRILLVGFVEKRGTRKKYEAEKYISSCTFFPQNFGIGTHVLKLVMTVFGTLISFIYIRCVFNRMELHRHQ